MQIVQRAGRDNGYVLVDAFHVDRSASRLEDLQQVEPSRLRYAQLCDAAGPRPDDRAEILRQARHEPRCPGEGDCDLACLPATVALNLEIPTRHLLEQGVIAEPRARYRLLTSAGSG